MKKFVPPPASPPRVPTQPKRPTGAAPPSRPPPAGAAVRVDYARPRRGRPLVILALVLTLACAATLAFREVRRGAILRAQWGMASAIPSGDVYALYLRAFAAAPLLMAVAGLLAAGACIAALRGRRPSAVVLLTLYAMTQVVLAVVYWVAAAYLVAQGSFLFVDAAGLTCTYRVGEAVLRNVPFTLLVYSLPLLAMPLLLIPAVRRAFLPPAAPPTRPLVARP